MLSPEATGMGFLNSSARVFSPFPAIDEFDVVFVPGELGPTRIILVANPGPDNFVPTLTCKSSAALRD